MRRSASSKLIQFAIFLAISLGTMGDTCTPNFGTVATNYKSALDQMLGTNYTEWANYALNGRLGQCVLAKPPAGSVFASRCSYYIRTKITNSQGLKGWPGGSGCIPNPNYTVNDLNIWGHTFTTSGYPLGPGGIATPPADVKAYAGQKIAELFHADTDDSRCDFTNYVANNNTRLSTFNSIDYLLPDQLNHIIFAQQTPDGPVSCGYYLPDRLPWLEANGTKSCRQPIFQLSANFCKIAYNRYIITHGGSIPTLGSGMIDFSTFTTQVGYQSLALVNNPEAVSSLTARFTGYDEIPLVTDFVPMKTGVANLTFTEYQISDGYIPFMGLGWMPNYATDVTRSVIFPATFANYTSASQPSPNNTFKGIPQSYVSPKLWALAAAYYTHFLPLTGTFSAGVNDVTYLQAHPGVDTPSFSLTSTYRRVIVPPVSATGNPDSDNVQNLTYYQLNSPPGLGGIPFNLLDGATVTYDYSSSSYKLQNTTISTFTTPQTFTQFNQLCSPGLSWQTQLVPVLNTSGLTSLIPAPPGTQ